MKLFLLNLALATGLVFGVPGAFAQEGATTESDPATVTAQVEESAPENAEEANPGSSETQKAEEIDAESPITGTLEGFRVEFTTAEDGSLRETLVVANSASPGDVLEYRGRYSNVSDSDLIGLIVNGPVPNGTTYIDGSQSINATATFEVQIQDEPWQELPAYKTIVNADGEEIRVEAGPSDYQQLRWRLEGSLEPETTAEMRYRVRVNR